MMIQYSCPRKFKCPNSKDYNDLLDRQSSRRDADEVTYLYVGDVFCIYHGTMYADFQEKIFAEISGKNS